MRALDLLAEMAEAIEQAAATLVGAFEQRLTVRAAWELIRDLEHKGDAPAPASGQGRPP